MAGAVLPRPLVPVFSCRYLGPVGGSPSSSRSSSAGPSLHFVRRLCCGSSHAIQPHEDAQVTGAQRTHKAVLSPACLADTCRRQARPFPGSPAPGTTDGRLSSGFSFLQVSGERDRTVHTPVTPSSPRVMFLGLLPVAAGGAFLLRGAERFAPCGCSVSGGP